MSFDDSAFYNDAYQIIDALIAEDPNIKLKVFDTRSRIKKAINELNKYKLSPPNMVKYVNTAINNYISQHNIEDSTSSDHSAQNSANASATASDSPLSSSQTSLPPSLTQSKSRSSRRRPADPSLMAKIMSEKSQEINIGKTGSSKSRSHVEFCRAIISQLNIEVDDNPFKPSPQARAAQDFNKDLDYSDLADAEEQFITLVIGKEAAEKFLSALERYTSAVEALRAKYIVQDPKKVQKFTYMKSNKRVKFFNPADKDKLAYLPEEEASPIVEFFTGPMEEFKQAWKSSFTSPKGEPAKKFNYFNYLKLDVIRTQNIIKFEQLMKLYPDIFAENTNKLTNTVLSSTNGEYSNLEEYAINSIVIGRFAPDYMALFSDLKNFNGTQFQNVIKNIYMHRSGIVLHEKCTKELKKKAWLQAFANICSLTLENIIDPHDRLIVEAWINVLSSRFAYHVIMNCVPESKLFNTAMLHLIQDETSIKLFQNVLYPISFAFTPFMLGHTALILPKAVNISEAAYKKELSKVFTEISSPSLKVYDYEACNWIYYMGRNGEMNTMVSLLHGVVKNAVTVDKKFEGSDVE